MTTQEVIVTNQLPPIGEVFEICRALAKEDPISTTPVFTVFRTYFSTAQSDEERDALIAARNMILRDRLIRQMEEQRYFKVECPYDDACIRCHGTGELYKFASKTVDVTCHICGGKKRVSIPCPDCENGRYIKTFEDGGSINVQCRRCKGTMEATAKCVNCKGEGTIPKIITLPMIKSTTTCPDCKGYGFITKGTHKGKPFNPAIDAELHKSLSAIIKQQ